MHNGVGVYIARHGQIASNLARRYAGRSAEPLSAKGRAQATAIAARLESLGITEVRTSDIARAAETAAIVGSALGVPVVSDPRLNEMAMGPWEGRTEDDIGRDYPEAWRLWNLRPDQLVLPGRETLETLAARVLPAVAEAAAERRPILLMTHVAPVRVATLRVLGESLSLYKQVRVDNADCLAVQLGNRDVRRLGESSSIREELRRGVAA